MSPRSSYFVSEHLYQRFYPTITVLKVLGNI